MGGFFLLSVLNPRFLGKNRHRQIGATRMAFTQSLPKLSLQTGYVQLARRSRRFDGIEANLVSQPVPARMKIAPDIP